MKNTIRLGMLAIGLAMFCGCGSKKPAANDAGPRITGGGEVDTSIRPIKPKMGSGRTPSPPPEQK